jgi:chromosome segregation ATPase
MTAAGLVAALLSLLGGVGGKAAFDMVRARRGTLASAERLARDELWKELARVRERVADLESKVDALQTERLALLAERDALRFNLTIALAERDASQSDLDEARAEFAAHRAHCSGAP